MGAIGNIQLYTLDRDFSLINEKNEITRCLPYELAQTLKVTGRLIQNRIVPPYYQGQRHKVIAPESVRDIPYYTMESNNENI